MKITIEVVGSVFRVEIDNQGTHERLSINDEASPEAGLQAEASPAGTGAGTLAGRESRSKGEAASVDLPTNSDGGLNIVHKHTEIQANPEETGTDGETATVPVVDAGSRPVAGRSATATSEDGRDSLERQAPNVSILRPQCKHKDACGGYGFNHCHSCLRGVNAEGSAA